MKYTQNNEQHYIDNYFKGYTGTLLDLGANDGITFSNSYKLITEGWKGVLVEASPTVFKKLKETHKEHFVECVNVAVGTENKEVTFYESGNLISPKDYGLVSTIDPNELKRWTDTIFRELKVPCVDYVNLLKMCEVQEFDFVSVDIEGMDYQVLTQIDLTKVKMICVEHNGKEIDKYLSYCKNFGMRELHRNAENLIMVK